MMIKTEAQRKQLIRWIMAVKRGRMEKFILDHYGHYGESDFSDKLTGERLWFQSLLTHEEIGKLFTQYIYSTEYTINGNKHTPMQMFWLGFKSLCFNTDVNDMKAIYEGYKDVIKEEDEKYKEVK